MPAAITISRKVPIDWGVVYCTGGTITTSGGKRIHTFTANGTLKVIAGGNVQVLVVGGGGGGGSHAGGGGGGGGYTYNAALAVGLGDKPVVVGIGGAGAAIYGRGDNGGNSSFDATILCDGGGGGAGQNIQPGSDGGSGGGGQGGTNPGQAAGAATGVGTGFAGGIGLQNSRGGGGGGASAVGATGAASGNGGEGLANSISGAAVIYASGGGGGGLGAVAGGAGGTGAGAGSTDNVVPGNGVNPGSGGGGSGGNGPPGWLAQNGGNGAAGSVIVSYPDLSASMITMIEAEPGTYARNLRPSAGPSAALAEAGTFSGYSHKIRGLGGFWRCSFVWHDELPVLMEMMAEGWVRDIRVMGERGMETWEGFVAGMELSITGGMPALKVTGYGYYCTLFWRVYNQTASGHVDAYIHDEVNAIATAVGQSIASQARENNFSLVDRYHDADRFAGDILFDMCAAGDIQNHRFLIGCYEERQLRYQEIARYKVV